MNNSYPDCIGNRYRLKRIFYGEYFFLLILLIMSNSNLYGQADPVKYTKEQWNDINKTENLTHKIQKIFGLAKYYSDYLGHDQIADSISQIAIQIAEESHMLDLRQLAYSSYIQSNNLYACYSKALGYALKAEQISLESSPKIIYQNTLNLATVYLAGYAYDNALNYSYKALSLITTYNNDLWKAESFLKIGNSLEGKNQKIEAFRNYLNALSLAERLKNIDLQIKCYDYLSHFYNLNRIYNKATQYKLMQIDLIKKQIPIDSSALIWTKYDLQVIDLTSNNNQFNESTMQHILEFAQRNNYKRLYKYELALIRTHLIESGQIKQLHSLYDQQFPAEMRNLAQENPGLFYRINAFFYEEEKMHDSALYYFNKAEKILQAHPNKIMQSNFYYRFGQFLLRSDLKDSALTKFNKSYELANEAAYFDYMLNASSQLELIHKKNGDYNKAYHYAVLNKELTDSINNMSKNDQFLILEIDHETRQRAQANELERQATVKRHSLQYTAMVIIIISIFLLLLMLGSLKVSEWIIKMLSFFSLIFFFEFIVLIADNKIHTITHGEPWKIMLIKIFLLAILFPMHHWIERRVVAFLLHPGLINIAKYPMRKKLSNLFNKTETNQH